MEPAYQTEDVTLYRGDCLEVLRTLPADSVDAVVTDPPAGIAFMGKEWDTPGAWRAPVAEHGFTDGSWRLPAPTIGTSRNPMCRRCRKHRRGAPDRSCSCEAPDYDDGDSRRVERDSFVGFLSAVLAECYRVARPGSRMLCWAIPRTSHWTGLAIEEAGWTIEDRVSHLFGQGFPKHKSKLKPACEDWWLAIKPARRAVPLNIDDCRIPAPDGDYGHAGNPERRPFARHSFNGAHDGSTKPTQAPPHPAGRWPANVVLDESAAAMLDAQAGDRPSGKTGRDGHKRNARDPGGIYGNGDGLWTDAGPAGHLFGDSGGASRFFYVPKAPKSDRDDGNIHPTVKHTELMRWLTRLITPPGGTVLDCFAGSGSTIVAAYFAGFKAIGIEREPEYFDLIPKRLQADAPLFG